MMRISPRSTAAIAGSASGFILQNHCVEARGSTIVLLRSHNPTACGVLGNFVQQSLRFQIFDNFLARFEAVHAGIRARRSIHLSVVASSH